MNSIRFVEYVKCTKGRHRSDKIVNNRMTQVISQNDFVDKKWKDIQVGDMIQIINEELITVCFSAPPHISLMLTFVNIKG